MATSNAITAMVMAAMNATELAQKSVVIAVEPGSPLTLMTTGI